MKFIISFIVIVFLVSCNEKKAPKITSGKEGQLMPVIDLKLIDSAHFNTNTIPKGKPTVLFAFEPWCPYCKAQTKSILSNIEQLRDINLYFLTNSPYPEFKKFYERFQLEKYPSIIAGIDYKLTFAQYFKTGLVPYFAIYDPNRRLKQVLAGRNYVTTIRSIATESFVSEK